MKNYKLGDMELEFANLIWENEPISSGGLVQLCELLSFFRCQLVSP